ATTPWQWATEHMQAQPRGFETISLSHPIPQPMRDAILKGLAKDPNDRFDSVAQFVEAMAAVDVPRTGPKDHSAAAVMATAAMEAAPDFGAPGAPQPTAAMPAQSAPVAVPAGPPHQTHNRADGSNKGLLLGLGAAAVVLVGAIGFILADGDDAEEASTLLIPSATTEVKPIDIAESPAGPALDEP